MLKDDRTIKRYSESFKLKVLSELAEGKYTKNEIRRVYGISAGGLDSWIKKYRRFDLLNQRLKIETMDETDKVKKLEEEISQLKELLVQSQIKGYLDDAYLEYAAEQLGFKSVEELKKAKTKATSKAVERAREDRICSITKFCKSINLTRDAYYKMRWREEQRTVMKNKVLDIVIKRRKILPREGGRKLYRSILEDLISNDISIGRDRFFDFLRENKLLVRPKKRYVRTTNSMHRFRKYPNLIKDMKITKSNQVCVSDITYIRLIKGHCYLALITDAYSRKIVGYDISDSLELAGCLRALKRALRQLPVGHTLTHHSDRGVQYCSYEYVNILKKNKIKISMTEENHCYENAIAERVNGILKDEFYLDQCFGNTKVAKNVGKSAIDLYNNERLHLSLDYKTPNMVHRNVA